MLPHELQRTERTEAFFEEIPSYRNTDGRAEGRRALRPRPEVLFLGIRVEASCPIPELVKTVPHVAFEVDDLESELRGKQILIAPNSPSEGVIVAFIVDEGAPVEFLQFDRPEGRDEGDRPS